MHCKCLRASESIIEKYAIRLAGQINIRLLLSLAYLNAQSIICLLVISSVIAESASNFRDLNFLPRLILCQIDVLHPARSDNFSHQQIVSQRVNAAAVFITEIINALIWKMNQKGETTFNSYVTQLSFESFTFMIIYLDKMFCPLETVKADTIWIMISNQNSKSSQMLFAVRQRTCFWSNLHLLHLELFILFGRRPSNTLLDLHNFSHSLLSLIQ